MICSNQVPLFDKTNCVWGVRALRFLTTDCIVKLVILLHSLTISFLNTLLFVDRDHNTLNWLQITPQIIVVWVEVGAIKWNKNPQKNSDFCTRSFINIFSHPCLFAPKAQKGKGRVCNRQGVFLNLSTWCFLSIRFSKLV